MKIAIIGIGHVGTAVGVKFAEVGHDVTGIDIDPRKIELFNNGKNPLLSDEPKLPELLAQVHLAGRIYATDNYTVRKTMEVIIIAVETPFDIRRKRPLYFALRSALEALAINLPREALVIVESTLAPRTTDTMIKPILEKGSNLKADIDFNLCHAPERVMPGKLLKNIETLDRVIGGITRICAERAKALYQQITKVTIDIISALMAEMVKTTENAYRDVQIAFANEISLLTHSLELNVFELRELVNKVPERHMLLPGAGVGGHCIPKDSWLLAYGASGKFQPKLLTDAREINDYMPHYTADLCEDALAQIGKSLTNSRIVILGVAFLENSGDIRNSPAITIIEDLSVFGCELVLHDPYVIQINHMEVEKNIEKAVKMSDALIIVTKHKDYLNLNWENLAKLIGPRPVLIDGRNTVSREIAEKAGFIYQGVGKYKQLK